SAAPDPVCPGETVNFSAWANCSGGDYEWSGDISGSGSSITESFEDPGSYEATVTYKLHNVEVSETLNVVVKEPSVIAEANPDPAYVGQAVTFSSSVDCGAEFSHWSGAINGDSSTEQETFS